MFLYRVPGASNGTPLPLACVMALHQSWLYEHRNTNSWLSQMGVPLFYHPTVDSFLICFSMGNLWFWWVFYGIPWDYPPFFCVCPKKNHIVMAPNIAIIPTWASKKARIFRRRHASIHVLGLFFAAVMTTADILSQTWLDFRATTGVITVVYQWVMKNAVSYFLKQHQFAWSRSTIEQSLTSIIQLDVSCIAMNIMNLVAERPIKSMKSNHLNHFKST